ncbi:MAG: hypothetical protein ABH826_01260 [Patescibacteria group bacterium]|nr:hypothetical protein [Patescibacteria group bacterium]
MTNKQKNLWGILSLILPVSTIVVVLIAYGIVNFTFSAISASGTSDLASTVGSLINLILGLVGILAIIGIPVGLIVGIILLVTKKPEPPQE